MEKREGAIWFRDFTPASGKDTCIYTAACKQGKPSHTHTALDHCNECICVVAPNAVHRAQDLWCNATSPDTTQQIRTIHKYLMNQMTKTAHSQYSVSTILLFPQ